MKMKFGKDYFEGLTSNYVNYTLNSVGGFYDVIALLIKKTINPKKSLDIGCAKGFLVNSLSNLGVDAYGVDISHYAISEAPHKIKDKLFEVDVCKSKLPFENNYFDFVSMMETIEHLENLKVKSEIERVLKPGGILLLTTPIKEEETDKDETHHNIHPPEFWINLFSGNGFNLINLTIDKDTKKEIISKLKNEINKGVKGNVMMRKIFGNKLVASLIYKKIYDTYKNNEGIFTFVKNV